MLVVTVIWGGISVLALLIYFFTVIATALLNLAATRSPEREMAQKCGVNRK